MKGTFEQKRAELVARLREYYDIHGAIALLGWDQATYMPLKGAPARARQLATLQRIAHEKRTDPEIGRLLDALQPYTEQLPTDDDDAALVRVTRRQYEQAIKVPVEFAAEFAAHTAEAYAAWTTARPADNFAAVKPYLQKTLEMSRTMADFFPGYQHIADPLIDLADFGMRADTIRPLFEELRQALAPLVKAIADRPQVDDSFLRCHYPAATQWAFGEAVIRDFGYDFTRGRQDTTHHPFMTKFARDDVRITTRIDEDELSGGMFTTMHEAGHALYELGINPTYAGTPLDDGTSAGVHESQSRLWENLIGRSAPFWQHYYPKLRDLFAEQLDGVSEELFYRAVNKVQPSLIRTEADEVTYNLHVIIRFGLELDLLEGKLTIDELPEAWHARYEENLGIHAPNDRDGVLQDVHWFGGTIGGSFQGYTLGNIMAAQFYAAAIKAHPEITREIAHGHFGALHNWLRENIYCHGSKYTAGELLARVTGGPLSITPYLDYLHTKFGAIYGL